jgi:hypothetical protein
MDQARILEAARALVERLDLIERDPRHQAAWGQAGSSSLLRKLRMIMPVLSTPDVGRGS